MVTPQIKEKFVQSKKSTWCYQVSAPSCREYRGKKQYFLPPSIFPSSSYLVTVKKKKKASWCWGLTYFNFFVQSSSDHLTRFEHWVLLIPQKLYSTDYDGNISYYLDWLVWLISNHFFCNSKGHPLISIPFTIMHWTNYLLLTHTNNPILLFYKLSK